MVFVTDLESHLADLLLIEVQEIKDRHFCRGALPFASCDSHFVRRMR